MTFSCDVLRRIALVVIALTVVSPARAMEPEPIVETPITAKDRSHWAFRTLSSESPPVVENGTWVRNEIDRFVVARLEAAGIRPNLDANREALLRRVTFDLTGLPPTLAEIDSFLADDSPDAYSKVVERLLASPAYGERWAQHWLDLARFAETDGFEHDKQRHNAWRYRDWVIASIANDVPYDEFLTLQIAGDEMQPDDASALIATGFTLCGPDMPDINLKSERRHMVLNEMTATVGSVFLGLQMGCAQCHDHKFDPISIADFYRMRAVFESALVFDDRPLPGVTSSIQNGKKGKKGKKPKGPHVRALFEKRAKGDPSYVWVRGDFRRRGASVEPAFPRIANPTNQAFVATSSKATTGRRSAFASWLTQGENFLTTRVIVNRIWQFHFGRPIVATPSDFGRSGAKPTHPKLLDWLARRIVEEGWSWKRLHRLVVLSSTYRQASLVASENLASAQAQDPDNDLLWRFPRRRLEGEAVRDAMLAIAGRASLTRSGGPGVMAKLPKEVLDTIRRDHWSVSKNEEAHRRRSVYLFVRRNLRYPLFEAFDRPDGNASCARRDRSTTAPQALMLLNSEFSVELARHFASRVLQEVGREPEAWITHGYRLALGRSPGAEERRVAHAFLRRQ